MIVKTLSANVAAIYLSADELKDRTDGGELCALIRDAQTERGMPAWKGMDASLFVCGEQVLLLAWPTEALSFVFSDFESLLSAAHSCSADLPASLTYWNDSWILLARCPCGRAPAALYEYGSRLDGSDALAAHFAEHGETIFAADALSRLQLYFPTR